jgi:cellulose synthase/poly-beta-1,6-N-acetylglucosamine synthase-like glycosyltransferase
MEVVVLILKIYLVFTVCVMLIYSIRHFTFTLNRLFSEQRAYYQDILDSELKNITVVVPMHNEEKVARQILDLLLQADYPAQVLEIIPINDFSSDATKEILDEYAGKYSFIKPLHRYEGARGKPAALNEAIALAEGEIIIVFDADYLPPKSILKDIAVSFSDPEIGAVMGRVIPINTGANMLTRLLDLERTGGYQVDQQARYNMKLVPQYGGTVGGFRKEFITAMGGFDTNILAEDTELTYRLLVSGWKVIYANRAECYEEAPEDWECGHARLCAGHAATRRSCSNICCPCLNQSFYPGKKKLTALFCFSFTLCPSFCCWGCVIRWRCFSWEKCISSRG